MRFSFLFSRKPNKKVAAPCKRPTVCSLTSRVCALLLFSALAGSVSLNAAADIKYHWEDRFTRAEKTKLTAWLDETQWALEQLVGQLPFVTHVYMHRAHSREPVPWANTERGSRQGVHFHVDPKFSLEDFREDWTAPHELSHLVIPYVGRTNSWFAEGFASYMQYQVMERMGVLDKRAMAKRYTKNLKRAERRYNHHRQPFAGAARALRAERNYPTMYWGGAAFFLQVDAQLEAKNEPSVIDVLRQFVSCCRRNHSNVEALTQEFDALAQSNLFSRRLRSFRIDPGFPEYPSLNPRS